MVSVRPCARDLLFRDPDNFTAGEIHFHLPRWDVIYFQGTYYDSAFPPSIKFSDSKSYAGFEDYLNKIILECLANGSLSIWGKVGFVSPPHLVMPLTVEPTKPRLCHDERSQSLDQGPPPHFGLHLPRYAAHNHFQSTMDDKSGYDHVRLSPKKQDIFRFGMVWMVFRV